MRPPSSSTQLRHPRRSAAFVAGLLAVAGCGLPTYDPLGLTEPVAFAGECRTDAECPASKRFCAIDTNRCIACRTTPDCADPRLECLGQSCERRAGVCDADADCLTPPGPCWSTQGNCALGRAECQYLPKSTSESCSDDDACTLGDRCDGNGGCLGAGTRLCDDELPCTEDACVSETGCLHTPRPDGASCGESGELCRGGVCACGTADRETSCVDGADNDCNEQIDCVDEGCDGAACTDANACTTGERCAGRACGGGASKSCVSPPPNGCWQPTGACDPATGECGYTRQAAGFACDDGNPCTHNDHCNAAGGCEGGGPVVCQTPPSVCLAATGTCDPQAGCRYAPLQSGIACNDGSLCTTKASCNGAGLCVALTTRLCDQPGACAQALGTCDPGSGACEYRPKAAGDSCRSAAGLCDAAETCDGTSLECPKDDVLAKTTRCRQSEGDCDVEEFCDGLAKDCGRDVLVDAGQSCRKTGLPCDRTESCDGLTAQCPADAVMPKETVCLAKNGECDLPDLCDGVSTACAPAYAPTSVSCRPAAGICDVGEVCSGHGPLCPPDDFVSAGKTCGSAKRCFQPAQCSGSDAACPAPEPQPPCYQGYPECPFARVCDGSGGCRSPVKEMPLNAGTCQDKVDNDCNGAIDCDETSCRGPAGNCF